MMRIIKSRRGRGRCFHRSTIRNSHLSVRLIIKKGERMEEEEEKVDGNRKRNGRINRKKTFQQVTLMLKLMLVPLILSVLCACVCFFLNYYYEFFLFEEKIPQWSNGSGWSSDQKQEGTKRGTSQLTSLLHGRREVSGA